MCTVFCLFPSRSSKYEYADGEFYANALLFFLINFGLLRAYMHSQPEASENHHESALDAHAIDINLYRQILFDLSQALVTAGLFSFGKKDHDAPGWPDCALVQVLALCHLVAFSLRCMLSSWKKTVQVLRLSL